MEVLKKFFRMKIEIFLDKKLKNEKFEKKIFDFTFTCCDWNALKCRGTSHVSTLTRATVAAPAEAFLAMSCLACPRTPHKSTRAHQIEFIFGAVSVICLCRAGFDGNALVRIGMSNVSVLANTPGHPLTLHRLIKLLIKARALTL